jgi:tetratricopeptide (TPR) repeat protein
MKKLSLVIIIVAATIQNSLAQTAHIQETKVVMKTYPFSDPDPVPDIGRIYPYFRFDGFTNKSIQKEWNMVILENDFIRVYVCPDIGGKIWGAVEKSIGMEFLYYNHVVKFRDVAMRGPWTSGGLEYNFGDIGHIPTCATPVDYITRNNPDGSVSCIVGAIDLPSRTNWNVEIIVYKDKAFVETKVTWFNCTSMPCTYYHWMNAAARADGNLEFLYPGNKTIGHGGEPGDWPVENGRNISFYENNNFGSYKSYHVINAWSDYFGGYWHDDDFGFGHYSTYDEKSGKKIWIWGLSQQGMIWEDLLTDNDGQYIEYQSGKLFNQAANSSTYTPFKHKEFYPYDADVINELWFPLKNTGGMVAASEYAVLNVTRKDSMAELFISALQPLDEDLEIRTGEKLITEKIILSPLELFSTHFTVDPEKEFTIKLGDNKLFYSSDKNDLIINRPVDPNPEFDWNSAYGIYTQALEMEKQRRFPEALAAFLNALEKEPAFLPSLDRVALGYYRAMDYEKSLEYARKSLMVDTYTPLGNYVLGLASAQKGDFALAKSGFSIASQSVEYRTAALTELATIFLNENNLPAAEHYAIKALSFNQYNTSAMEILALISRKENDTDKASKILSDLESLDPLNHFVSYEKVKWRTCDTTLFKKRISNELPSETYLELALKYRKYGSVEDVVEILKMAPENPVILLWLAYLDKERQENWLKQALDISPELVFPYRDETAMILEYFIQKNNNWKLKYYLAMICWNKGLLQRAKDLFIQCGDEPDFVPFYLARAKIFTGNREMEFNSLTKAKEFNNSDWRLNLEWINFYLKNKEYTQALKLAKKYQEEYPENSVFGFKYAKALMELKEYQKCISFLGKYVVLPNEGAMEGRNIYHETCIRAAYNALQQNNYKNTVRYAQKAKEWPENLGVGKPYDIDERLDNFIIAYAYEKMGMNSKADEYYLKIMGHITQSYLNENSKLILQVIVLKKYKQEEKAKELINNAIDKYPDNEYIKWVKSFSDSNTLIGPGSEKHKENVGPQPYDTKYTDAEFKLVYDLIKLIK